MPGSSPLVTVIDDQALWDSEVDRLGGHPLQLWGWGQVKADGAWTSHHVEISLGDQTIGLAQVLVRQLPSPFRSLAHVPRGPVVPDPALRGLVCDAVANWCRKEIGGISVTFEPDWDAADPLEVAGAVPSPNPILYPKTLILDLSKTEDELLAAMSRTTRYDIRKGLRTGLDVRRVETEDEVRGVLDVYHETAARAGFALHDDEYYLAIHRYLGERSLLVAAFDADGKPCSFVWDVVSATTAFELYGGQNDAGRSLRANAPVKWKAVTISRDAGLRRYDMNGLLNDGISEFKKSFAQHEDELTGSFDVPFSPLYSMWNKALPLAKKAVRKVRG
jgi:lipid II:glycine glycyltransferase (peptidoglycan interpeptide bridge formation enzyme)